MRLLAAGALLVVLIQQAAGQGEERLKFSAAAVNSPQTQHTVGPMSHSSLVLRAQIALHRAHFSCGEIDGSYGRNLQRATAAFQRFHRLPTTGIIGVETWALLNRDPGPMLIPYTISYEDLAGPFERIPRDMIAKSRFNYMGYNSALEELSERFHSSPHLLQVLNPDKKFDRPGVEVWVPNVLSTLRGKAASLVVSKSDTSVVALDRVGKVLAYYRASIGSEHDPLPLGTWKILSIQWYPKFYYNPKLFWDANPTQFGASNTSGLD